MWLFVNLSLKSHSGGDTLLQLRSEENYSKEPAGRFEGEQIRTTLLELLLCPCQPFKMSCWKIWGSFPSSLAPEAPNIKCILCATLTPNLWDQTASTLAVRFPALYQTWINANWWLSYRKCRYRSRFLSQPTSTLRRFIFPSCLVYFVFSRMRSCFEPDRKTKRRCSPNQHH